MLLGEFLGAAHLGTYYTIGIVLAWMCSSKILALASAPHMTTLTSVLGRAKRFPDFSSVQRGWPMVEDSSLLAPQQPIDPWDKGGTRIHPFRATSHEYRQTSVNKMLRFGCKGAIKVVLSAITSWE